MKDEVFKIKNTNCKKYAKPNRVAHWMKRMDFWKNLAVVCLERRMESMHSIRTTPETHYASPFTTFPISPFLASTS